MPGGIVDSVLTMDVSPPDRRTAPRHSRHLTAPAVFATSDAVASGTKYLVAEGGSMPNGLEPQRSGVFG